jgi:outer membrane protein OmpA-like peptidoglycan-associated protein
MRAAVLLWASFALGIAGQGHAVADPEVKANEIIDFFAPAAEGTTRGLCVGTAEECNKIKLAGFDMLINFELNSTEFTPQGKENLEEFAKALSDKRLSSAHFVVEGHTDALGSDEYNMGLSERRAQVVKNFLLEKGVSTAMVTAVGLGEKKPRESDPADPLNRRVEMRIQGQ